MTMTPKFVSVVLAAFGLLAGCGPSVQTAAAERADRTSRLYAKAMDEFKAGRLDAAVKGFEEVLRSEPGNGNARFQLATIYAEGKKDYLAAVCNYREYLVLRPDSDKAPIARERMKRCEAYYAADATAHSEAVVTLRKELEDLKKVHAECQKRIATAETRCADAEDRAHKAEIAIAMKNRLLASAGEDDDGAKAPRKIVLTDTELLDAEDDGTRLRKDVVAQLRAELDAEEHGDASNPFAKKMSAPTNAVPLASKKEKKEPVQHPDTYTVQEGDTLMQLAIRFYGDKSAWRRIRDANRTIVSVDGRINAGQELKLPR